MRFIGYAAAFSFTVRYAEGEGWARRTKIERVCFSCGHTHATIFEAEVCAHELIRRPEYCAAPWWNAARVLEDDAGELHFEEASSPEERTQVREANIMLSPFGWG